MRILIFFHNFLFFSVQIVSSFASNKNFCTKLSENAKFRLIFRLGSCFQFQAFISNIVCLTSSLLELIKSLGCHQVVKQKRHKIRLTRPQALFSLLIFARWSCLPIMHYVVCTEMSTVQYALCLVCCLAMGTLSLSYPWDTSSSKLIKLKHHETDRYRWHVLCIYLFIY